MIRLLDVNVLVALAWPNHAHHGPARAWALEQADRGWATSPVTELGFLRLSTTEHVVGAKVSPVQALELLRRLVAHPAHEFWPDDVRLIDGAPVRLATARQMTDAHLLVLARAHGGCLLTFDRGVAALADDSSAVETLG